MVELPEVEQMQQIGGPAAISEQLRVARAARDLRRELVCPQTAKRAVQGDACAGEAILAQETRDREWVLRLGHRMQVPAIQLAELLAVLAEVESQVSGEAGPVGIAFFDAHMPTLETDEDLGVRVRIERRLKADFEFSGIEVVALHAAPGGVAADVSGDTDLRIELCLVALSPHRLRQRIALRRVPATASCSLARGRAQRGKIVTDRRGSRWFASLCRKQAVDLREIGRAHV